MICPTALNLKMALLGFFGGSDMGSWELLSYFWSPNIILVFK